MPNMLSFENIRGRFESATSTAGNKSQVSVPMMCLIVVAAGCVILPMELSQLIFALIGALAYAVLQSLQPNIKPSKGKAVGLPFKRQVQVLVAKGARLDQTPEAAGRQKVAVVRSPIRRQVEAGRTQDRDLTPVGKEVRKPSSMPIQELQLRSAGWDSEIRELIAQIMPTAESDAVVQKLVQTVKATICSAIPEAEVIGFASGDLARGKAFGVAVPDVDVVISVSPDVLASRLQGRFSQGRPPTKGVDARKLQKSMIRVCTDKMVSVGGFKFRRSAFRGDEPKVTLLAPASLGVAGDAIPVDFSVNSVTPLYNAALLTECGKLDPRAKELILLVKRWAKDRGICHAAKGHLSPYLWSLLTIYYLQVGVSAEGPVLPPVEEFQMSSELMKGNGGSLRSNSQWKKGSGPHASVGDLFKGFMRFYHEEFDWKKEAIGVRLGKRSPPGLGLPLHIIVAEDKATTQVGPSIENPFDESQNLGINATLASLERLFEELKRAHKICVEAREASVAALLTPWIPPEQEPPEEEGADGAK